MPKASQNNFFCMCGHTQRSHSTGKFGFYCQGCSGYRSKTYSTYHHEFKLDNLRFLEQKYEEKTIEA